MLRCSPLSIFPKMVILVDENLEKGRNFDKYGQMALAYPDFNDMSVFIVNEIQQILKSCSDLWFGTGRLTLQLTLISELVILNYFLEGTSFVYWIPKLVPNWLIYWKMASKYCGYCVEYEIGFELFCNRSTVMKVW